MEIWIYDIEVYQNLFMFTAIHKDNPKLVKKFLIYYYKDKKGQEWNVNEYHELVRFCNRPNTKHLFWLVGYNNREYDDQIINFSILNYWMFKGKSSREITKELYGLSTDIINSQREGGKSYNNYKNGDYFSSIDLMRVAGLHKESTRKGLKQLAVNLKWHRIQDLPIPFDKPVLPEQVEPMFDYNINDCGITRAVYLGNEERKVTGKYLPKRKSIQGLAEAIRLRKGITDQYGINVMSEDKSGISNKLFEQLYALKTGLHPSQFRNLRTERLKVDFKDAIFTDSIRFTSPELKGWLDYLLKQSVICNTGKITIEVPSFWYGGLEYQFGAGGLHSVDKGAIFEACAKYRFIDADVGSFYPRIIINKRVKPAHLSDAFLGIMEELTDGRLYDKKEAKRYKGDKNFEMQLKYETAAESKKIVVNSTFGKLGSNFSMMYDPLAMIQVTINGQLYLMMLAERLTQAGFQIVSANTDGLTAKVERSREDEYMAICKAWEEETQFELEYAYYQKYIRRNVNNYLVLKEIPEGEEFSYDDHIKTKGDLDPFLYENFEKGFDKPVVSLAVYNHFIHGIPIQETIRNHDDIYDYCMSKKNGAAYASEFYFVDNGEVKKEVLQKSNRYYISNRGNGGKLIKAKDTYTTDGKKGKRKQAQMVAGEYVTVFNDYREAEGRRLIDAYGIKDMYYIIEAQKIIDDIVPKQQILALF